MNWYYIDRDYTAWGPFKTKLEAMNCSGFEVPIGRKISAGFYDVVSEFTGETAGYVGTKEMLILHGFDYAFSPST